MAKRTRLGGLSAAGKPVSPHALGAVAVLIGIGWTFRSTLADGVALHGVVAPFALFVLGPRWGVVAVAGGALFAAGAGAFPWGHLPARVLFDGLLPLTIAWGWLRLVERSLPTQPFVYLFVAVFAGTLIAVLGAGALEVWVIGSPQGFGRAATAWIALLILADGEAVATGMLVAGLAIYRPAWLQTFDADRYLGRTASSR
jgi:uncharacterized membrane protein